MTVLRTYNINFASLPDGIHKFDYHVDDIFLDQFDLSLVKVADVQVHLVMNKTVHCLELEFDIKGTVELPCDICADEFDLAIENTELILAKLVAEVPAENNELNVVYISDGHHSISVAQMIYEIIMLSIPMRKVHPLDDNDNPTCNPIVLDYLDQSLDNLAETADENKKINPIWEELKKLKK